ncbi:MAG: ABC transporter ATP-binding protein/permease, partial [Oscillospiraceae bacterium]|nr:ABC transporter ATP-binding protein/permease [Oscillospiraceae bacterium]
VLIFVNLCNFVIQPINIVPQYWANRKAAQALIEKLAQVTEENAGRAGEPIPPALDEAIILDSVTFGYEPDKPVLQDLTLRLEPGKKYAVVGGSGSGKSTLLNLLMGAYDSYGGSITIDGRELREVDTDSLYDLMSLIGQSVFLFDDTIRNNITMFRDFPDQQVDDAVRRSGLSDLLAQRGEGYRCGENGVALSGGERQRVSIARCLLRGAPVLLLDEATAALDNQTAFAVTDAILHLDGLTRVVVTHRLDAALMEQYDEIIVLRNGRVQERGSFDRLMEQKEFFYSLYTLSA